MIRLYWRKFVVLLRIDGKGSLRRWVRKLLAIVISCSLAWFFLDLLLDRKKPTGQQAIERGEIAFVWWMEKTCNETVDKQRIVTTNKKYIDYVDAGKAEVYYQVNQEYVADNGVKTWIVFLVYKDIMLLNYVLSYNIETLGKGIECKEKTNAAN